jgi:hypothetical protein
MVKPLNNSLETKIPGKTWYRRIAIKVCFPPPLVRKLTVAVVSLANAKLVEATKVNAPGVATAPSSSAKDNKIKESAQVTCGNDTAGDVGDQSRDQDTTIMWTIPSETLLSALTTL